MSLIEDLAAAYERFVKLPWDPSLAPRERVWMVVYPPEQERRLRMRIGEFEVATQRAGHGWKLVDLTDEFATWMAQQEYREEYFVNPKDMVLTLDEFGEYLIERTHAAVTSDEVDDQTVVALTGLASLFGLSRASTLIEAVNKDVPGRLLAFFPGERDGTNYRLLGARDGWNYLAIPITATEG